MGSCLRGAFPPVDIRAVCLVRRGGAIPPVDVLVDGEDFETFSVEAVLGITKN